MASPTKRRAGDINTFPKNKRRKMPDEVSEEDINSLIEHLGMPRTIPKVVQEYSNQNQAFDIQAYAKLAGCNWTFYVQSTEVAIGRSSPPEENDQIQIDLAPAKVVSRKHAVICYIPEGKYWGITILGRNGIKVDKVSYKEGTVPLRSGTILDIGGLQMMFVLPTDPPQVSKEMWTLLNNNVSAKNGSTTTNNNGEEVVKVEQQYPPPPSGAIGVPMVNEPASQAYPRGVAIITRPQVRGVDTTSEYEQDYSKDESKDIKPPYSYATMISQAILSTNDMMMSLADIYDWIASRYSFYRHSKSGWQNSIRHNLSLNKAFEKVPRKAHEPGKGMKWQISAAYKEEYIQRATGGRVTRKRRSQQPQEQQLQFQVHSVPPQSQLPAAAAPPPPQLQAHPQPQPQVVAPPHPPHHLTSAASTTSTATTLTTTTTENDKNEMHSDNDDKKGGDEEDDDNKTSPVKNGSNNADSAQSLAPPSAPPPSVTPSRQQYPVSNLAYTPDRGSSKPVGPPSSQKLTSSFVNNVSGMNMTPAPQPAHLQLAPPSSGQAQQLPSSYLPGSSPAPFWKYMQFSTPMRDDSPTKKTPESQKPHRHGHQTQSHSQQQQNQQQQSSQTDKDKSDKLGDLQDVDLTRGFRQIGKWREAKETPEKINT